MGRSESFRTVGRSALDSKSRISLTRVVRELTRVLGPIDAEGLTFRIAVNDEGQVLLSPEISVPAREAWLFRNTEARESVQRGLLESEQGAFIKRGSFGAYEHDEID